MIKVVQFGLGAMGAGMAQLVCSRPGYQLVGVVDRRPDLAGHDMGDLPGFEDAAGIRISPDAEGLLEQTKPDITLLATGSFISDIYDDLQNILRSGSNCITIAEEMAYPWRSHFFEANALDMLAKEHGVSLLGAGVNPGFVLDVLVLLLSGVCSRVESIHATRVNDLSPFGPTVMRTQGVGLSPEAFAEGIQSGEIVGHIGFRQSIDMIADSLGWTLDEIQEERWPILSNTLRETPHVRVSPGMVAGCRHIARGISGGNTVILLEHPQQVLPELENVATGDSIEIKGEPPISLRIQPEIPGGRATINLAVNMIPQVLGSRAGLLSMPDLPLPRLTGTVER